MKLKVDNIEFNVLLDKTNLNKNKTAIIFLHGFTGSAYDWHFIFDKLPHNFFPAAIDLIGHGETESPEDQSQYMCSAIVHHINSITDQLGINKFIIVGYSMGGRAALSFSLKHPEKIIASILESTTAGIEEMPAKKERVELDLLFADKIRTEGIESFVEFWFDTPLFESLKKLPNYEQEKNKRNQNSVIGLTNTLAAFSTGLMTSYWDRLSALTFPVLLVSGQLDNKYTKINNLMQSKFPNAEHINVPWCGHNVHIEKPELFTKFVIDFLKSLN